MSSEPSRGCMQEHFIFFFFAHKWESKSFCNVVLWGQAATNMFLDACDDWTKHLRLFKLNRELIAVSNLFRLFPFEMIVYKIPKA